MSCDMDFVTLGMFIIDDIYPPPSAKDQTPRRSVVGGAGTYSAIGARLLSPPPLAKGVGWIIDCGTDFPPELASIIESWDTGVLLRQRNGLTTKGWNGYGVNDHRAFKYMTPKLRLTANDLSPRLLHARSFHLICSPLRCMELVETVLARRGMSAERPIFIWEPVPDLCVPAELENTLQAVKHVDVISPNHTELAALFDVSAVDAAGDVNREAMEMCSEKLLVAADGSSGLSVVVRTGKDGCYIACRSQTPHKAWQPAYHASSPECVVDPTGGGNGFLGGLAVGLVRRSGDAVMAAAWGSVSASFCIEQVGVPILESKQGKGGDERWNGADVDQRLVEFVTRCGLEERCRSKGWPVGLG